MTAARCIELNRIVETISKASKKAEIKPKFLAASIGFCYKENAFQIYTEKKNIIWWRMFKMILKFAIQTVFEILLVVGIIYGFVHEDKLIAFEDKLAEKFKKR